MDWTADGAWPDQPLQAVSVLMLVSADLTEQQWPADADIMPFRQAWTDQACLDRTDRFC